jgi:hypothetical protein
MYILEIAEEYSLLQLRNTFIYFPITNATPVLRYDWGNNHYFSFLSFFTPYFGCLFLFLLSFFFSHVPFTLCLWYESQFNFGTVYYKGCNSWGRLSLFHLQYLVICEEWITYFEVRSVRMSIISVAVTPPLSRLLIGAPFASLFDQVLATAVVHCTDITFSAFE